MTANEVLTAAIDVNKTTQAETAKRFGWTAQQLGQPRAGAHGGGADGLKPLVEAGRGRDGGLAQTPQLV